MKRYLFFLPVMMMLFACGHSGDIDKTDPLESGRGFIEATLKGDYIKGDQYLLHDSLNNGYFNTLKDFSNNLTREDRYGYANASIIIDSLVPVSDSVNIIYYSNSYKKKPQKIKMVKQDNEWVVDFKYTFLNN